MLIFEQEWVILPQGNSLEDEGGGEIKTTKVVTLFVKSAVESVRAGIFRKPDPVGRS